MIQCLLPLPEPMIEQVTLHSSVASQPGYADTQQPHRQQVPSQASLEQRFRGLPQRIGEVRCFWQCLLPDLCPEIPPSRAEALLFQMVVIPLHFDPRGFLEAFVIHTVMRDTFEDVVRR